MLRRAPVVLRRARRSQQRTSAPAATSSGRCGGGEVDCQDRRVLWREGLYAIAQFSFLWFGFEMVWHLYIATAGTDVSINGGLWLIVFSQLLPLWLTVILWRTVEYRARLAREWESEDCSLCCGVRRLRALVALLPRVRQGREEGGRQAVGPVHVHMLDGADEPVLCPLEIFTGLSLFTWFGAGVYVGPTCIVLAGLCAPRTSAATRRWTTGSRTTSRRR